MRRARFLLALPALLVAAAHLRGQTPDRDLKISVDGKELQPGEALVFPDPPLDPDVKMLSTCYTIDDGQPDSDPSARRYNVICSERHGQRLKIPKTVQDFEFYIRNESQPVRPGISVNRFCIPKRRLKMTRAPAGSKVIGEKIINALGEARDQDQIRGFNIDLEIEKGMVILSGDVPSQEQRQLVGKIVRGVPEALQVENRLVVRANK